MRFILPGPVSSRPGLSLPGGSGLLLAACCLILVAATAAAGVESSLSRLNRVALAISREAVPVRADFALIAIREMTAAHTAEAERARQDARDSKQPRELVRWAGAVDAYAAELAAVGETLTPETTVDISIGHDSSVYLNIAGTPVMVGTPRARDQSGFERRIIEQFCAAYRCDDFADDLVPAEVHTRQTGQPPSWSFSQYAGPACSTADGLELQFRTMQDLGRKREICTRLVTELNRLLAAIVTETGAGVRIDWNRLEIRGDPNAGQQHVVLNDQGGVLQLALPGLAVVPDFLRQSLPWVAARAKGEGYHLVLLNADTLVAPLLYP